MALSMGLSQLCPSSLHESDPIVNISVCVGVLKCVHNRVYVDKTLFNLHEVIILKDMEESITKILQIYVLDLYK